MQAAHGARGQGPGRRARGRLHQLGGGAPLHARCAARLSPQPSRRGAAAAREQRRRADRGAGRRPPACGLLRVPVARPEGLVFETLLREPVLVAMPRDHRFAGAARRRAHRCRWRSCARKTSSSCAAPVRRACTPTCWRCATRRVCSPRVVAEVDRMMTNLNLVAAGVGLSVVPASMAGVHPHADPLRARWPAASARCAADAGVARGRGQPAGAAFRRAAARAARRGMTQPASPRHCGRWRGSPRWQRRVAHARQARPGRIGRCA